MKRILFVLLAALMVGQSKGQEGITLCYTPVTEKFAMFASSKEFNRNHPKPLPFVLQTPAGKMITLKVTDGMEANAYYLQPAEKSDRWVFVFQEWWGLNDYIKQEAEKYFKSLGIVHVLALDMYDGKVAADPETAGKYMQQFKQERGTAIVQAALEFAGRKARVATVGWCFGGGQSMQATLTAGKQAVACAIYYGMPEENVDRLRQLNCDGTWLGF
jgi:carboxymethylenebutenolidase